MIASGALHTQTYTINWMCAAITANDLYAKDEYWLLHRFKMHKPEASKLLL